MDPVTIVGLIGTATALAVTCGRIVKGLHDLKDKLNETNLTLSNILLECTTLAAAIDLIKKWIEGTPIGLQGSLAEPNQALIGFDAALKPIHKDILDTLKKAKPSGVLPYKVKLSAVWNETKMKEYLENVRWQGRAMQLILAATLL